MAKLNRIARSAVPLACMMMGAAACASLVDGRQAIDVRPVSTQSGADVPADSGYYESAVDAIMKRDYGLALNFLQAARAVEPQSARVLNAFGVVYDKLGRFDLSARYYAQAKAADPQSAIVARNMAYSRVLQNLANGGAPTDVAANAAPPVTETQTEILPGVTRQMAETALAPQAPQDVPRLALADTGAAPHAGSRVDAGPSQPVPADLTFNRPLLRANVASSGPHAEWLAGPALPAVEIPQFLRTVETISALPVRAETGPAGGLTVSLPRLPEEPAPVIVTHDRSLADIRIGEHAPQALTVALPQLPEEPAPVIVTHDRSLADVRIGEHAPQALTVALPQLPEEPPAIALPYSSRLANARIEPAAPRPVSMVLPALPESPMRAIAPTRAAPAIPAILRQGATLASAQKPLRIATAVAAKAVARRPAALPAPVHPAQFRHAPKPLLAAAMPAGGQGAYAKRVLLTGHPLIIVNASAEKGADDPIRRSLLERKWSVARARLFEPYKAAFSTLFYAEPNYAVARALARTLAMPVRLVANDCRCGGLRLVIGSDALSRRFSELDNGDEVRAKASIARILTGRLGAQW